MLRRIEFAFEIISELLKFSLLQVKSDHIPAQKKERWHWKTEKLLMTPSPPRYPKNTNYSTVNNRSCNTFSIYFTLVILTFGLRRCMKMKHNFNSLTNNRLFHPPHAWLQMFQDNVAMNNTNFDSLTKNMFIVFCACWRGLEWCPKILDIDGTITKKESIHKYVTTINNNNK